MSALLSYDEQIIMKLCFTEQYDKIVSNLDKKLSKSLDIIDYKKYGFVKTDHMIMSYPAFQKFDHNLYYMYSFYNKHFDITTLCFHSISDFAHPIYFKSLTEVGDFFEHIEVSEVLNVAIILST